jgi:hypothetical protein
MMASLLLAASPAIAAATAAAPPPPQSSSLQRVVFGNATAAALGARCLDGSASGYYVRLSASNSTRWLMYLQGGGLCVEPVDCLARVKNGLGSSKYWAATWSDDDSDDGAGLLSGDPGVNPFSDWNRVYVPYCGGDMHVGTRRTVNSVGLYHAGHLTLAAIVSHLRTSGLGDATSVMLAGGSAGGYGCIQSADWLGEQLAQFAPQAQLTATPQAGFFFPNDTMCDFAAFEDSKCDEAFPPPFVAYLNDAWEGAFDQSCVGAHPLEPWRCGDVAVAYPHVRTPLFLAQNMYDSVQLQDVFLCFFGLLGCPPAYTQYFGEVSRRAMQEMVLRGAGE